MIYIENKDGLIGDFLGSVSAIQALGKTDKLVVQVHPEAMKLVPLIANPDEIVFTDRPVGGHVVKTIHSATAFSIATAKDLYMSQAYFEQVGLPIPSVAPKALLQYDYVDVPLYDYIISPYARSLPDNQKWSKENWQALVDSMPDKTFCVIGSKEHDDPSFMPTAMNVYGLYGVNFNYLCNLLISSTKGLISVVTGTSHLAFHLGVKNWILNNQDFKWGTNPDGYSLRTPIPQLSAKELKSFLESNT